MVGVGETSYYKRGQSPDAEFKLAPMATLAACEDARISPKDVHGFAFFSNAAAIRRLANALGIRDLRFSNMQWGGGGSAAIAHAAAAMANRQRGAPSGVGCAKPGVKNPPQSGDIVLTYPPVPGAPA